MEENMFINFIKKLSVPTESVARSVVKWLGCIGLLIFSLFPIGGQASGLSLQLESANLADTIRLVAKFLQINVILSPAISGSATLHLNNAPPQQTFDVLLESHGLAKWRRGNIWLIAPRGELIKQQQEEVKWQEIQLESESLLTRTWKVKYGNAEEIAHLLTGEQASFLSKRGKVYVDKRTNMICMRDVRTQIEEAERLIQYLDVPVPQVVIKARLVSIDNDFERELGIQFAVKSKKEAEGSSAMPHFSSAARYSLAVAKLADGSLLDVKLSALENEGHAELISTPTLFATNQQPALIEAGEEVPYQEVSESGGTAVTFKKAVLGLKVVPQVLPGNRVLLQLQINQDRPGDRMVMGVPTISTRQMMTNALLNNGETIVLGGIYEINKEQGQQRVPFVYRLPLVGELFRLKRTKERKRELLIFVTPSIFR